MTWTLSSGACWSTVHPPFISCGDDRATRHGYQKGELPNNVRPPFRLKVRPTAGMATYSPGRIAVGGVTEGADQARFLEPRLRGLVTLLECESRAVLTTLEIEVDGTSEAFMISVEPAQDGSIPMSVIVDGGSTMTVSLGERGTIVFVTMI